MKTSVFFIVGIPGPECYPLAQGILGGSVGSLHDVDDWLEGPSLDESGVVGAGVGGDALRIK